MFRRRQSSIQCFFCQASLALPRDPKNFKCTTCGCWNRYNAVGEIISDEPAMHDEALNARSFARRGSPSKDRLPTMYGPRQTPFCHTCQTNQMLLVNLLSNYLPSPTSPEYETRLAQLPAYRESLHARYPPVCETCAPIVDEEIERKNNMARTQALGGWLQQTKGKVQERRVSGTMKEREKMASQLLAWRVRGCLWAASVALSVSGHLSGARGQLLTNRLSFLQPIMPFLVLLSILWNFWDPTYARLRRAQMQGRDVRVHGKTNHLILQWIIWSSRFTTAILLALHPYANPLGINRRPPSHISALYFTISLCLEILIGFSSLFVMKLQHPPAVRLLDSNRVSLSRAGTPNPPTRADTPTTANPDLTEPDLFSLSLSSKPILAARSHVFGQPSLGTAPASHDDDMDWTPTTLTAPPPTDDAEWMRPQRFFAPETPTGLEDLFERTRLVEDVTMVDAASPGRPQFQKYLPWIVLAILPISVASGYHLWRNGVVTPSAFVRTPVSVGQLSVSPPVVSPPPIVQAME